MNQDQVTSAIRWVLSTGGAYLVTRGILSGDVLTWLVGGAGPLVAFVWSMAFHAK